MTDPRPAVRIHLRNPPASAGLLWIRRGMRMFLRRPMGFLGLFGFALITLVLLKLTPPPVQVLSLALMPLLSLGYMIATQAVIDDLPVRPGVFIAPLLGDAATRRSLLWIGMGYVVISLLIYLLGEALAGDEVKAWSQAMLTPRADGKMPDPLPLSNVGTAILMLQTFGIAIASIPLWHAPALAHWGRQGAAQAMFSSVVALWRTRAAFAVYLLGWCGIGLLAMIAISVLLAILGDLSMVVLVMTPALWSLTAVFYISTWFGFMDTFEITSTAARRVPPGGSGPAGA